MYIRNSAAYRPSTPTPKPQKFRKESIWPPPLPGKINYLCSGFLYSLQSDFSIEMKVKNAKIANISTILLYSIYKGFSTIICWECPMMVCGKHAKIYLCQFDIHTMVSIIYTHCLISLIFPAKQRNIIERWSSLNDNAFTNNCINDFQNFSQFFPKNIFLSKRAKTYSSVMNNGCET